MEWLNLFYDGFLMAEPISIITASIGAITALAGGIKGGIDASKAKKVQSDRERTQRENLMSDINQDWLNRSENRQFLKQLREQYQEQNDANRRMNIVTGATEEQKLASEEAKNKQFANVFGKMAQGASSYIDNRKALFQQQQDANAKVWSDIYNKEMEQSANLTDNGINVLSQSMDSIADNVDWTPNPKKTKPKLSHNAIDNFTRGALGLL
jgi:HD superfamily phosphohydrolase